MGLHGFLSAADILQIREQHMLKLSTGCAEFDKILGGGVETGSLTEVHGEWRTGKSQLALTLAVMSLMPEHLGGGQGRVLAIDTEDNVRVPHKACSPLRPRAHHGGSRARLRAPSPTRPSAVPP